jgi:CspA family cold shock protein
MSTAVTQGARTPITGTIKRLVHDKGFGFIAASDGGEYFFHQSAVQGSGFHDLREGQAVTFSVEKSENAKRPADVRAERIRPE